MRTTITLEDDVAAKVRAEMRRTGGSLKETINRLLHLGLSHQPARAARKRFVVKARPLGLMPGLDYDRTSELLEQIEAPYRR